jgi:hypothetical protein
VGSRYDAIVYDRLRVGAVPLLVAGKMTYTLVVAVAAIEDAEVVVAKPVE